MYPHEPSAIRRRCARYLYQAVKRGLGAWGTDVYQLYADMICFDERRLPEGEPGGFCVCVGRRDGSGLAHTHEEILDQYGGRLVMQGQTPPADWPGMGRLYAACLPDPKQIDEFLAFLQE